MNDITEMRGLLDLLESSEKSVDWETVYDIIETKTNQAFQLARMPDGKLYRVRGFSTDKKPFEMQNLYHIIEYLFRNSGDTLHLAVAQRSEDNLSETFEITSRTPLPDVYDYIEKSIQNFEKRFRSAKTRHYNKMQMKYQVAWEQAINKLGLENENIKLKPLDGLRTPNYEHEIRTVRMPLSYYDHKFYRFRKGLEFHSLFHEIRHAWQHCNNMSSKKDLLHITQIRSRVAQFIMDRFGRYPDEFSAELVSWHGRNPDNFLISAVIVDDKEDQCFWKLGPGTFTGNDIAENIDDIISNKVYLETMIDIRKDDEEYQKYRHIPWEKDADDQAEYAEKEFMKLSNQE